MLDHAGPRLAATDKHNPRHSLRDTFDTNFFAVVELTQTLLPLIRKSKAGRIVNVSSFRVAYSAG